MPPEGGAHGYDIARNNEDGCITVVLKP